MIVDPCDADIFLKTLDEEAERVGATRGSGRDVKSEIRLFGPSHLLETHDFDWITPHIRNTCRVCIPNTSSEILGTKLGTNADIDEQFSECTDKVSHLHNQIGLVDDVATELILTRKCADTCKISHLLQTRGHDISSHNLEAFDELIRRSLERILRGSISDSSLL